MRVISLRAAINYRGHRSFTRTSHLSLATHQSGKVEHDATIPHTGFLCVALNCYKSTVSEVREPRDMFLLASRLLQTESDRFYGSLFYLSYALHTPGCHALDADDVVRGVADHPNSRRAPVLSLLGFIHTGQIGSVACRRLLSSPRILYLGIPLGVYQNPLSPRSFANEFPEEISVLCRCCCCHLLFSRAS